MKDVIYLITTPVRLLASLLLTIFLPLIILVLAVSGFDVSDEIQEYYYNIWKK